MLYSLRIVLYSAFYWLVYEIFEFKYVQICYNSFLVNLNFSLCFSLH